MSRLAALRRAARMDRAELQFRVTSEARNAVDRLRHRFLPPRWRRADLAAVVDVGAVRGLTEAAAARNFASAQVALASHFSARTSCWPVQAVRRAELRAAVLELFPDAPVDAAARADKICAGRYDLLGYRSLSAGSLPDWHRDPVHGRRAPSGFWASIKYLDPACGDHKIIWEFNRHQHWLTLGRAYWLNGDERYRAICIAQLRHWMRTNPPLEGMNWASSLELALRAISWTYAVEFFSRDTGDGDPWLVDLLVALDRQLSHVEHNLSLYFSPNTHLTGEALALYAVSRAFPELRSSARRAQLGREVLLTQASRQVRGDGGHAELSAHYHRYSTDFYLLATLVARASGDPAARRFESAARAQAEYLRTMADDWGALPLIGDDDGGQLFPFCGSRPANAAPTLWAAAEVFDDATLEAAGTMPEEALWILGRQPRPSIRLARQRPWPSRCLRDSGYFVSRKCGSHFVFDAGPHGFLNGGHAHADALQVILTVAGRAVLVDPGTGTYTMDPPARDRFRSSRMHNTAIVDGHEHIVPRGPFHWLTTDDARFSAVHLGRGFDFAQGTHDAHAPLRHVRTVAALDGLGWLVVDQLLGGGEHELEAWWHVHPDLDVQLAHDRRLLTLESDPHWSMDIAWSGGDATVLRDHPLAVFAPEYGRIQPAAAIRTCRRATAPFAIATFIAAPAGVLRDMTVTELTVSRRPPGAFDGRAFAITSGATRLTVLTAAPLNGQAQPWPSTMSWGTDDVRTDGRFAVVSTTEMTVATIAVVDGEVTRNAGRRMASAVHEAEGARSEARGADV